MSSKEKYKVLFSYHFDTLAKLMDQAEALGTEGVQEKPSNGRSMHELFLHILDTDRGWRMGLERGFRPEHLDPEDYVSLNALRSRLSEERSAWMELIDDAEGSFLDGIAELKSRDGRQFSFDRWRVMQHVILHGMQHHAELAASLTDKGNSPGDIDFIFYR